VHLDKNVYVHQIMHLFFSICYYFYRNFNNCNFS